MKKIALLILLVASTAFAQTADLSPSVNVTAPTATKIQIANININPADKVMIVGYRWIDANGRPIYAPGRGGKFDAVWIAADDADADPPVTTFSDIFSFQIRQQDVGQTLGKGMRALIINRMKQDIPVLNGVTITFND